MDKKYAKLAAEKTLELLKIDSPSGFTENAAAWVYSEAWDTTLRAPIKAE